MMIAGPTLPVSPVHSATVFIENHSFERGRSICTLIKRVNYLKNLITNRFLIKKGDFHIAVTLISITNNKEREFKEEFY